MSNKNFRIYRNAEDLVRAIQDSLGNGVHGVLTGNEISVFTGDDLFCLGHFNLRYTDHGWVLSSGGLVSSMPSRSVVRLLQCIGHETE